MYCPKCAKELADGSAFCPYCGTKIAQPAPQQPVYQAPPVQAPQQPMYYAGGVSPSDVSSTKTLGVVSLIAAFFVPLVSFICGGIGISKVKQFKAVATPEQQQELEKSRKLALAGIIVAALLTVLSIVLSIAWGVYIGKTIANEFAKNYDSGSYSYNQDDIDDQMEDYFEQYGIEIEE